jgi:hypothetical protein
MVFEAKKNYVLEKKPLRKKNVKNHPPSLRRCAYRELVKKKNRKHCINYFTILWSMEEREWKIPFYTRM